MNPLSCCVCLPVSPRVEQEAVPKLLSRYLFQTIMSAKHVLSHYDPAVNEAHNALQLAKSTGASQEVISSIEKVLKLVDLRENFTDHATTTESEACRSIIEATYNEDWDSVHAQGKSQWKLTPRMLSGPLEGQFLKSLVSIQKAKRILDIGMFTGYSALSMAEALPADGEMVTIDMCDYLKTFVTPMFEKSPHGKKIKIRIGKATEILKQMAADGEQFDMIFLDADKSEYLDYFKVAFKDNLLKPGGTVLVDNAYRHGQGYMPEFGESVTKLFADAVVSDSSLHSVLVPLRDGVTIIRRKSEVEGATA